MNVDRIRHSIVALVAIALIFGAACNKQAAPTDAQMASDVQSKINADQNIQNKQIAVQAASGVVTLSGQVASDNERNAAAGDAAAVAGVHTVVNNLAVQPPETSAQAQPQQPPAETPPAEPPAKEKRSHKPQASQQMQPAQSQPMTQAEMPPAPAAPVQNTPPAPPPPPPPVTVPAGTTLSVRMLDTLDSESNNSGDTFRATLNSPVTVNGQTVIPIDADVYGRVVAVQSAGRFKGAGLLTLELSKVSYNGHTYSIVTDQWSKQTQGRGKGTAEKVGGGAALGAIIGALAGGGKGAAIGTAVGAGAGGTAQGVTKPNQIKLGPESLLSFHLNQSVTVEAASQSDRNSGRRKLE
jgi:outer membrane biosynthesis protein TonB